MEFFSILAKLGGVFALVFLNGFFVAAEFAIVKVRSTQIEPLAQKGSKRARIAQNVIGHLDAYLSATQLGITLTSLGLGWMGEPFVAHMLDPVLAVPGGHQSRRRHHALVRASDSASSRSCTSCSANSLRSHLRSSARRVSRLPSHRRSICSSSCSGRSSGC